MKTTYIVEVPDTLEPIFPEICVACGHAQPEKLESIVMSDAEGCGRTNFFFYKIIKKPGQGKLLKIPVHDSCAKKIRGRFLKRLFLCFAIFAIIAAAGTITDFSVELSFIIALIISVPFLYFEIMKTLPVEFDYNSIKKLFIIVFNDKTYANIFAKQNNSKVKEESN
jgi:hypothetical protein